MPYRSSLKQSIDINLELTTTQKFVQVNSKSVKRKSNVIFGDFLTTNEVEKPLYDESRNKYRSVDKNSVSQNFEKQSKASHEKSFPKSDSDNGTKVGFRASKQLLASKKNIESTSNVGKSAPKSSALSRKESCASDELKYSHMSSSN